MPPVRLQQIADLANVSRSTASRALRSDPQISAATRERVRAVAREIGYAPDPVISRWASQAWKSRRSLNCGYQLAFISSSNTFGKSKFLRASERARELGYGLEFYSLREMGGWHRINQVIRAKSTPGVLLNSWPQNCPMDLDSQNLSVVCCGVGEQEFPFHTVRLNTFRQMEIIWHKAMERGRRRAFIWLQEPRDSLHGRHHYGAALECERRFKARMRITDTLFERPEAASFVRQVLRSKSDVVISLVTNHVDDILRRLRQKGWQGEWLVLRSNTGCGLSGLKVHDNEVARESVNLLDRLVRDYAVGIPENPLDVLLAPVWNEESAGL